MAIMRTSVLFLAVCATAALAAPNDVTGYEHTARDFTSDTTKRSYDTRTVTADTPLFSYKELWDLQSGFWDRFLYPNNEKEVESINSTVFSENVQGRVSDTRDFNGRELNTEYIFGLFVPHDGASLIGLPQSYKILQFAANQNIASATTRVEFVWPNNNNLTLPVTIDTWITWNEKKEITQYDATFRWFNFLINTLVNQADPSNATKAATDTVGAIAHSVCASHDTYCNGTNTQYASNQECLEFLTTQVRVGQAWEFGMNTLMCRSLHEIMLKYRPNEHCPHVGKTGGGMCVDQTYTDKVMEDYFTNAPWIPSETQGKGCTKDTR